MEVIWLVIIIRVRMTCSCNFPNSKEELTPNDCFPFQHKYVIVIEKSYLKNPPFLEFLSEFLKNHLSCFFKHTKWERIFSLQKPLCSKIRMTFKIQFINDAADEI